VRDVRRARAGPALRTIFCSHMGSCLFSCRSYTCTLPSLVTAAKQGLTLLHFSAQLKRFLWDRGCIQGLFRGSFAGV